MGLRHSQREVCNHEIQSEQRVPIYLTFAPLAVAFVVVRTKPFLPLASLSDLSTSGVRHRPSVAVRWMSGAATPVPIASQFCLDARRH